jgi:hypothetical protein
LYYIYALKYMKNAAANSDGVLWSTIVQRPWRITRVNVLGSTNVGEYGWNSSECCERLAEVVEIDCKSQRFDPISESPASGNTTAHVVVGKRLKGFLMEENHEGFSR